MKILLACVVLALAATGCSAKQKANFEKVTGTICKQVRELEASIKLGTELIPDETARMVLGLTYRELIAQCDIRDELFAE